MPQRLALEFDKIRRNTRTNTELRERGASVQPHVADLEAAKSSGLPVATLEGQSPEPAPSEVGVEEVAVQSTSA